MKSKCLCIALLVMLLGVVGVPSVGAVTYAPGFIPNVTATASSSYSVADRGPMKMVNNSGITEDLVGSKTGLHNTNGGNGGDMYLNDNASITTASGGLAATTIDFDLGATHNLDEMWVWNTNQTSYLYRGYKCVYIRYRVNATDAWVTLGGDGTSFTLAQAPGTANLPATNLVGGKPISFGKIPVRYVRIQPAGGPGVGNYDTRATPQFFSGLAEVRFYEVSTAPEPTVASVQPFSINYGSVQTGKEAQAQLVVSAVGGTGSITVTGASFATASQVSFATAPTWPMTLNAGKQSTFTLAFRPQAVGVHLTTLTLNVTIDGAAATKVVPIQGTGVQYVSGFVPNVVATASSAYIGRGQEKTVDSSGITEDLAAAGSKTGTHGGDTSTLWLSATDSVVNAQWIQFDLRQPVILNEMYIWNHNQAGYLGRSVKECKIFYKENLGDDWTQLGGASKIFTLKQAPGAVTAATNQDANAGPITFGGVQARYVRLAVVSNWLATETYVGLSEVRFYSFVNAVNAWSMFD